MSFETNYDSALEWVQIQSGYFTTHQLVPQGMVVEVLLQQNEEHKVCIIKSDIMIIILTHLKKFRTELLAKQTDIDKLLQKGNEILKSAHPDAVPIIQKMIQQLENEWDNLTGMAGDHNKKLVAALLELQGVEECVVEMSEKLTSIQIQARTEVDFKLKDVEALGLESINAQLAKHEV